MKLTFLGTASCFPTPARGVSCTALTLDEGGVWLFDCGEGSQIQLQKCQNLRSGKVVKIFITHLHGDHLFGLPGLLCTLGNGCDVNTTEKIIDIYGPYGLRNYLITSLELSRSVPSLKFNVHELMPIKEQFPDDWSEWDTNFEYCGKSAAKVGEISFTKIYSSNLKALDIQISASNDDKDPLKSIIEESIDDDNAIYWDVCSSNDSTYLVKAGALKHRIPSFGYVIIEKDKPGKLDVNRLQKDYQLKPGPLYGQIKPGKVIEVGDGRKISSDDYLGPPKRGRKVSILGDTCDSSQLVCICKDSDLLVHEATMENSLCIKAIEYGHSTPEMAANFANLVNAKKLCLTHLSPRYKPHSRIIDKTQSSLEKIDAGLSADILKSEADHYLQGIQNKMEVLIAEDFFVLPVIKMP